MTAEVWISGEQQTVNGLLDRRLADDPHGEYLDVCGTKLSAAEVASAANRLATTLAAMGVRPGDRVATLVENSAEALLAWWGIVRGGAVAVPINTAYKGEYLRHQLTDSGSRVLIVEASLADRVARISQRHAGARARRGHRRRRRAARRHGPHVGRRAGQRRRRTRGDRAPGRPGHVHLHRRHDGPVEGLHAQPQLPRGPDPPDRHLLATHGRRRGVDAAADVPLQRHRHRGARARSSTAGGRRSTGGSRCRTSGPR